MWLRKLQESYKLLEGMRVYRGRSVGNVGGHYWSLDKEFARQFTQSGLDREIESRIIDGDEILVLDPLPSANSEAEISLAIEKARAGGFMGFMVSEGRNQPNSIFLL
jgi:hypothetical protein